MQASGRYLGVMVLICAILAIICGTSFYFLIFRHSSGVTNRVEDLPIVAKYLQALRPRGQISWVCDRNSSRYSLVVSGDSSLSDIKAFARSLGLDCSRGIGSVELVPIQIRKFSGDSPNIVTSFETSSYVVAGHCSTHDNIELYFNEGTRKFTALFWN